MNKTNINNLNLTSMKKTLLFLVSLLMTMGAWADEVTFDFTGESAYGMTLLSGSATDYNEDPYTCKEGDIALTLNGNTRWWKTSKGNVLRFYKGSSMNIAAPEGNVVTSVVFTTSDASKFSSTVGTYDKGTWTGSLNSVDITCDITKSNAAISKITVTYQKSDAPQKKNPGLAFSETAATATMGATFAAPTLTKETTADVVYSSSNEDVATVSATTGEVTLVGAGTTVITAKAEENDAYLAGSASYTLTVEASADEVVNSPYSESFASDFGLFTFDNVSLGEGLSYVWKIDTQYKYAKASAYVNKKNIASESWLVSPWIKVADGDKLSFDQAISKFFGTVADEATVWIKVKDDADWTQVTDITYPELPEGKNFSSFENQAVDLAQYAGKTIKVGFKYVSTSSAAGTWEIKNFKVGSTTGINKVVTDNADSDAPVYNLAGQRVGKNAKGVLIKNGKKYVVK